MSDRGKDTARKLSATVLPIRDESFRVLSASDKAKARKPENQQYDLGWQAIQFSQTEKTDKTHRKHSRDAEDDLILTAQLDWRNICHRVHELEEEVDDLLYPDSRVFAIQLVIDDKYKPEYTPQEEIDYKPGTLKTKIHGPNLKLNRSTEIRREMDGHKGDLDELWAVRAYPLTEDYDLGMSAAHRTAQYGDPNNPVSGDSTLPNALHGFNTEGQPPIDSDEWTEYSRFKLMTLINLPGDMGCGWVTDIDPKGVSKVVRYDENVARPTGKIAQWGDVFVLTNDDLMTFTLDQDVHTLLNVRHDAHFHMGKEDASDTLRDGRIYFTRTPPGTEPAGLPYKGEMVGDPVVANTNTIFFKESVNWRPQIKTPYGALTAVIVAADGYDFPEVVSIGTKGARAMKFPENGAPE